MDWLVGCLGFNGPLRQYFSLYRAVSQRERERGERIDESKNVQTTPTRTYCKRNRPLPYCNPNCRTPRHWKFTQHHRTTRPPTLVVEGSLVGCFRINGPLRQYFSLYRAVKHKTTNQPIYFLFQFCKPLCDMTRVKHPTDCDSNRRGVWSGGAMVLDKLPGPGRPTSLDKSRARAYCTCSRFGWGLLDIFTLTYPFSFLSPSLWETTRYRLKYCLKGSLSPKTTKQRNQRGNGSHMVRIQ